MKRIVLIIAGVLSVTFTVYAQKCIDPDKYSREAGLVVGAYGPPGTSSYSLEFSCGMDYAQYFYRGLGFKTGFRYQSNNIDMDNWFSIPMAFSYRSRMTTWGRSVYDAAVAATKGAVDGYYYYGTEPSVGGWFENFFGALFNRADFFVGVTPGYIQGNGYITRVYMDDNQEEWQDSGIKKNSPFFLTADAGFTLTWRIWRFTLNFSPAVHYMITDSYRDYYFNHVKGNTSSSKSIPIRWQLSFEGGLRYLF